MKMYLYSTSVLAGLDGLLKKLRSVMASYCRMGTYFVPTEITIHEACYCSNYVYTMCVNTYVLRSANLKKNNSALSVITA